MTSIGLRRIFSASSRTVICAGMMISVTVATDSLTRGPQRPQAWKMAVAVHWGGLCCPGDANDYFRRRRRHPGNCYEMTRRTRLRWKGRAANCCDSGWIARWSARARGAAAGSRRTGRPLRRIRLSGFLGRNRVAGIRLRRPIGRRCLRACARLFRTRAFRILITHYTSLHYPQKPKLVSQAINTVRAATQSAEQKARAARCRSLSVSGAIVMWIVSGNRRTVSGNRRTESEGMMRGGASVVTDQVIPTSR